MKPYALANSKGHTLDRVRSELNLQKFFQGRSVVMMWRPFFIRTNGEQTRTINNQKYKAMRAIKNQIKEVIDFTSVSSVTEADAMFDTYLNHIKDAFKRMRRATNWTMRDATQIYDFAISILTDRYVEALLKLDKFARSNYKFYE